MPDCNFSGCSRRASTRMSGFTRASGRGEERGAQFTPGGFHFTTRARSKRPVCTENLNPDIVVMESAEDGERFDASGPLNRASNRRILVQRSTRSDVVVIACVRSQNPA